MKKELVTEKRTVYNVEDVVFIKDNKAKLKFNISIDPGFDVFEAEPYNGYWTTNIIKGVSPFEKEEILQQLFKVYKDNYDFERGILKGVITDVNEQKNITILRNFLSNGNGLPIRIYDIHLPDYKEAQQITWNSKQDDLIKPKDSNLTQNQFNIASQIIKSMNKLKLDFF